MQPRTRPAALAASFALALAVALDTVKAKRCTVAVPGGGKGGPESR